MTIDKHLEILGFKVKDKVTGFEGIATSISFDLYGCIQVIVNPGLDKDGKFKDQQWFDIARLSKTGNKRVMEIPDYGNINVSEGKKGPAEKPMSIKV